MSANYLILDIETGGIGLDKSLLTARFEVVTPAFETVDALSLHMKPNDGIYHADGQALRTNKINLADHDIVAKTYRAAGSLLYDFLKRNAEDGKEKLIRVGHGVRMDIFHICDKLISDGSWNTFVSYQCLDTSSVAQFFKVCGLLPSYCQGSLSSLYEYYCGEIEGQIHTADFDVYMTKEILKNMVAECFLRKVVNLEQCTW